MPDQQLQTILSIRPDSVLKVSSDPRSLFYDTFDAALDTTDRWTTGGTAPSSTTGTLTFNQGTVATTASWVVSKPTFQLLGNMFSEAVMIATFDTAVKTGCYRFLGFGVPAGSPTPTLPMTNGVGFEWNDTTGAFAGVVWSGSARTQSVTLTLTASLLDGNPHRFNVYYKTSRAYFEVDNITVGSIAYPNPQVSNLPVLALAVNGAATVSPAATMTMSFFGVGDSSSTHTFVSDGTFPFRKAGVDANGALRVKRSMDVGRNATNYFMAAAVATTTGEVMQSLTGYKGGVAVGATVTPVVVTAAKTYRVQKVTITFIGITAIGSALVTLRANLSGVGIVSSPLVMSWQVGMPAVFTAGAAATYTFEYGEGLEFAAGTGLAVGVVGKGADGTTSTAVGAVLVAIEGFEYTT